jgi:hypothetical protein
MPRSEKRGAQIVSASHEPHFSSTRRGRVACRDRPPPATDSITCRRQWPRTPDGLLPHPARRVLQLQLERKRHPRHHQRQPAAPAATISPAGSCCPRSARWTPPMLPPHPGTPDHVQGHPRPREPPGTGHRPRRSPKMHTSCVPSHPHRQQSKHPLILQSRRPEQPRRTTLISGGHRNASSSA